MKIENIAQRDSAKRIALILTISLFFLWALTANLLPTLIPHLKKACRLTNFESSLLDTAYWMAYPIMAIPAAMLMNRTNYKTGIVVGLLMASFGAFMFVPAAEIRAYWFFLLSSFILASGMTFLETAANPYITLLGTPETATQRINFAQAFNGLGAFISAMFLSKAILSGHEYTDAQLNEMSSVQLSDYLNSEAVAVKLPYIGIAVLLLVIAVLFIVVRFPELEEEKQKEKRSYFNLELLKKAQLSGGIVAQFFYCGGQTCISSFFIRYCAFEGIPETTATTYLGFLLLSFMIGRYVGAQLLKRIEGPKLLVIYAAIAVLLLFYTIVGGKFSVFALFGVEFCMSIMYPTIFSLAIRGLGGDTKTAAGFMVMAIIGGALIPPVMGLLLDAANFQVAFIVPFVCFFMVAFYGLASRRQAALNTTI